MEGLLSLQGLILAMMSGGGGAAAASIWNSRHKPKIERQGANDSSLKTQSEIYSSDVDSLRDILTEQRTHHDRFVTEMSGRMASLEVRVEKYRVENQVLEVRVSKTELAYEQAEQYIKTLVQHIEDGLGPPPPERR